MGVAHGRYKRCEQSHGRSDPIAMGFHMPRWYNRHSTLCPVGQCCTGTLQRKVSPDDLYSECWNYMNHEVRVGAKSVKIARDVA